MPDIDGGDYEAGAAGDKRAFFHAVDNSFVAFGAVVLRGEGGNNLRESKEEHQRQTFNALTGGNCGNFAGTQLVNRNLENDAANNLRERRCKRYADNSAVEDNDCNYVEDRVHKERR